MTFRGRRETADVVLLDISMPGMNSYDVTKQFRSMFGHKVLLIAITAYGSAEAKRRCLEAGFDEHFVKPVNPENVLRRLTELAASFQRTEDQQVNMILADVTLEGLARRRRRATTSCGTS